MEADLAVAGDGGKVPALGSGARAVLGAVLPVLSVLRRHTRRGTYKVTTAPWATSPSTEVQRSERPRGRMRDPAPATSGTKSPLGVKGRMSPDAGGGVVEADGDGAAEETDAEGVGSLNLTFQTGGQPGSGRWDYRLTLIGVTGGALVGLGSVVSLVEALVAAGLSDTVVAGEEPGLLGSGGV